MPIGVAIIGAGLFVQEEYLPAIQSCYLLSLKAVFSRSEASATALATKDNIDAYFETPATPGRSIDDLLARTDIKAVIIAIPIVPQFDYIKKAMAAGKHVLSEKPIANDVDKAEKLIDYHKSCDGRTLWGVAENYRFLPGTLYAAEQLRKIGGLVQTFKVNLFLRIPDDDRFLATEWRKNPIHQGGFLLDGGIHFVAGLRDLLAGAGEYIKEVVAYTSQLDARTPPFETVHALLRTNKGAAGTFSQSFMTEFKGGFEFEVVTQKGAVTFTPMGVEVTTRDAKGEKYTHKADYPLNHGIKNVVGTFAKGVQDGKLAKQFSPVEALADLCVLQAMFESNGHPKTML
ncbi:oxidoreductase-like protein [Dactylonectria macrodidyma]|uniref:Oxidoreductase-like protein n=1 Tax=Dactylonectria macrodidyma TaxID=307937 RepID=A0A9P9FVD2_9HYPO|nr:oxidoreductase-like protein [Dactylonectria macrodidyma]